MQDLLWFADKCICESCISRLCFWATAFQVFTQFPCSIVPAILDVKTALHKLIDIRPQCKPRALRVLHDIRQVPDPRKIVVFCDLPSKDWLVKNGLSQPFCENPRYMCCAPHMAEQYSNYCQLFRYSLCNKCVEGFWKWAVVEGHVLWWKWDLEDYYPSKKSDFPLIEASPSEVVRLCFRCCRNHIQISEIMREDGKEIPKQIDTSLSHTVDIRTGTHFALLPPDQITEAGIFLEVSYFCLFLPPMFKLLCDLNWFCV